jgi:hypothetical protein
MMHIALRLDWQGNKEVEEKKEKIDPQTSWLHEDLHKPVCHAIP